MGGVCNCVFIRVCFVPLFSHDVTYFTVMSHRLFCVGGGGRGTAIPTQNMTVHSKAENL